MRREKSFSIEIVYNIFLFFFFITFASSTSYLVFFNLFEFTWRTYVGIDTRNEAIQKSIYESSDITTSANIPL